MNAAGRDSPECGTRSESMPRCIQHYDISIHQAVPQASWDSERQRQAGAWALPSVSPGGVPTSWLGGMQRPICLPDGVAPLTKKKESCMDHGVCMVVMVESDASYYITDTCAQFYSRQVCVCVCVGQVMFNRTSCVRLVSSNLDFNWCVCVFLVCS